jgi:hypothetical protein
VFQTGRSYRCLGLLAHQINLPDGRPFRCNATHRFSAEVFNLFNPANFGRPDNTIMNPTFGQDLSAGDPRTLQFPLRYPF